MPNIIRQFEKSGFYHIYNRGNHREPVYHEAFDYQYFLSLLADNAAKFDITIVAYCLMRNHYHLLVRQRADNPMSIQKLIGNSVMSYAHYFNKKYNQVGSLFQGRYRSKAVLSDAYLLHLTQYIHLNPSEFADPITYTWSSIQAYLNRRRSIADPAYILSMLGNKPYELQQKKSDLCDQ